MALPTNIISITDLMRTHGITKPYSRLTVDPYGSLITTTTVSAPPGGPIIPKTILGGKTYFFGNYEGFRWNNSQTYEVAVPSADMRAGILHFDVCNASCVAGTTAPVPTVFNLNNGTNCGRAVMWPATLGLGYQSFGSANVEHV